MITYNKIQEKASFRFNFKINIIKSGCGYSNLIFYILSGNLITIIISSAYRHKIKLRYIFFVSFFFFLYSLYFLFCMTFVISLVIYFHRDKIIFPKILYCGYLKLFNKLTYISFDRTLLHQTTLISLILIDFNVIGWYENLESGMNNNKRSV